VENKTVINIKFRYIAIAAYLYVVIPIMIYFLTWLRPYIGIPMAVILSIGLYVLIKSDYICNRDDIALPRVTLILVFFVFLIWVWLSGQGGFFYQTWDNHSRNAIFRDMIDFDWPVIYPETGNALVYYMMYWIVPALFGKIFGWLVGNISLALWTFLGTIISYLLIVYICKCFTVSRLWLVCIIFITWSGLNILGMVFSTTFGLTQNEMFTFGRLNIGSMEGWLDGVRNGFDSSYLFRSNFDALSQIYNQTVIIWLLVPLVLENRKVRNLAFIGLCMLIYAPIPFIGFLPILLAIAIPWYYRKYKSKSYNEIIKQTLSIPNISAVFTIFIVAVFLFKSNVQTGNIGLFVPIQAFDIVRILTLILFYFMEFGLICIFIYPMYKKDVLFYVAIMTLVIIPIFKVGTGRDLCMNASLPALFLLMIMTINYCKDKNVKVMTPRMICISLALIIAAMSPIFDICKRIEIINLTNRFPIVADRTKTLSNKNIGDYCPDTYLENYLVPNPKSKAFYKYLAKE